MTIPANGLNARARRFPAELSIESLLRIEPA